MDYISTKEAADRWEVKVRYVQRLLHEGRIPEAKRYGNYWLIPADAQKPADPRRARKQRAHTFFTLPRRCPELIFTELYSVSGSADEVAASLSYDGEAQRLFMAQLAYFRGDTEEAKLLARELLHLTSRTDVRMGCCFVLCLAAMYDGDAAAWARGRTVLSLTPCGSPEEGAQRDFQLGNVDSGLYDKNGFPEWFRRGSFDPLPGDCYPMARMAFIKWLMLSRNDPGLSAVCGPFISQSRLEGALLSEIYCRLITAIGFHDRGQYDRAAEHIDAAIALALPDRLYAPLAEERSELGVLLDERLALADKDALAAVRELYKRLIVGWAVLQKDIRGMKYTPSLTQREHHAAKLAIKGLSNAEVAARMGVSVNSVKRYISEAIAKTGAADRTELAAYIAFDGKSLP